MNKIEGSDTMPDQIIEWCLGYGEAEAHLSTGQRVEFVRNALTIAVHEKRLELQREVAHYTILAKRLDGFIFCNESPEKPHSTSTD
jgi:hypothetical protein